MKLNNIKVAGMISYASLILGMIISILYTPFMVSKLGVSEFGLYNFVRSIVAYLGLLNFGFSSAYVRYYTRYKKNDDYLGISKLNGMFLMIFILISLLIIFISIIIHQNFSFLMGTQFTISEVETAKKLFIILTFNLVVTFTTMVFDLHIIANEKFIFQKVVQLIKTLSSPLLSIMLLTMGYGSVGLAVVTTLISLTMSIILIYYNLRIVQFNFTMRGLDHKVFMELVVFSSYVFINMVTDQINWNVDKYLIGRIHGSIQVGVYSVAASLNIYYLTMSTAISSLFGPRVNRLVIDENNKALTQLFIKIGRIQFLVLSYIAMGFILLGSTFIRFWVGPEFDEAYLTTLFLMLPITIDLIQNVAIEIQRAKNLHKFRSIVIFLIALANIVISIPLIQKYGVIGAAMGTAVSLLLGNGLIMNIYYHRVIKLDIILFWRKLCPLIICIIVIGIINRQIINRINIDTMLMFILSTLIYSIIFMCVMWFFGINDDEKNILKPSRYIKL